jgi:hypothetical protein
MNKIIFIQQITPKIQPIVQEERKCDLVLSNFWTFVQLNYVPLELLKKREERIKALETELAMIKHEASKLRQSIKILRI